MKVKKLLFSIALALTIICSNAQGEVLSNQIQAAVKIEDSAYNYIKELDANYPKRIAGSQVEKDTAEYIKNELISFGYVVDIQDFEYTRKSIITQSQNVIAIKEGKSDKQIIVGSHYDSVGTNGAGDNGSGVAVNLAAAKEMAKKDSDYTIIFIFFGAEETGLNGSKAYANNMSQEEIDKTILMINMDSLLAGTYTYIYGGSVINKGEENQQVIDTWGVEQGLQLNEELGLSLVTNDTELNYDYPTPTTGNWSDHASFKNIGIPHIYLEASNWKVLDNPSKPEYGSSGDAETEIGRVMHVEARDNLEFIEATWPDRSKHNIKTFATFLINYLVRVDPAGLKPAPSIALPKKKTLTKGNYTYYYVLNKNNKYDHIKTVKKVKNSVTTYKYSKGKLTNISIVNSKNNKVISKEFKNYNTKKQLTKYQKNNYKNNKLSNKFIKKYQNKNITNSYNYTYDSKSKLSSKVFKKYKVNKNNKSINTYLQKNLYYSNNKIKSSKTVHNNMNDKITKKSVLTYTKKGYKNEKIISYYKNYLIKKITYSYNNKGQLKSNKNGSASKFTKKYNKQGYVNFWQIQFYNHNGKLV